MSLSVSTTRNEGIFDFVKGCNPVDSTKDSNGGVSITCADRRSIYQAPGGPIEIYDPIKDQTEYRDPEGKLLSIKAKEWTMTPQTDGRHKYEYLDGAVIYSNKETGQIEKKSADGKTATVIDTQKCTIKSESTLPNGKRVVKYADKNTSHIVIHEMVPVKYYADGSVAFGTSQPIPIDRSQAKTEDRITKIPYGDNNFFIEEKNGTKKIELHPTNGSVITVEFLTPEYCQKQ